MAEDISHETYKNEIAGGTIPFNFDEGPHDGVKCPECDVVSPEEDYEWVDTNAYREDSGRVDVTRITLLCPACGDRWVAHM